MASLSQTTKTVINGYWTTKDSIEWHTEKGSIFNHRRIIMARRRKSGSLLSNKYVKYTLYGLGAYYLYAWYMGQQSTVPMIAQVTKSPVAVPQPTVSAFPNY